MNQIVNQEALTQLVTRDELYLASSIVMVIRLIVVDFWGTVDVVSESDKFRSVKKPGSFGSGRSISLLSIRTAVDIFGLSSGLRCTHNSAT